MCSILGVSFAPGSTISRHRLASALLSEGQVRGRDASGYAWVSPTENGMYKKDVPGANLYVGKIPQDATAIIAHTRAHTHGDPSDNNNNHPLESPNGFIRLVHNGVIWNHNEVRQYFDTDYQKMLPAVDSSVIGAVLETYGLDSTKVIEGDAACAWFDSETGDTIHLARFQNSPVHYVTLEDGSFVFASTASILYGALKRLNLSWFGSFPQPFDSMHESDYFRIIAGEVVSEDNTEWGDEYRSRSAYTTNWRDVTSGATTTPSSVVKSTVTPGAQEPNKTPATGASFGTKAVESPKVGNPNTDDTPMVLTKENGELNDTGKAVVKSLLDQKKGSEDESFTTSRLFDPNEDDPEYAEWTEEDSVEASAPFRDLFFAWSEDGDYTTYTTLSGLLAFLSWSSKLSGSENHLVGPEEGYLRWINHFTDIGHLSTDQTDELSWVKSSSNFEVYRNQVPEWVRDGVSKLTNLVGA